MKFLKQPFMAVGPQMEYSSTCSPLDTADWASKTLRSVRKCQALADLNVPQDVTSRMFPISEGARLVTSSCVRVKLSHLM